jgi:hypothetical protein
LPKPHHIETPTDTPDGQTLPSSINPAPFVVLVSDSDVSEKDGVALLYITWVSLGLSITCLLLTALVILVAYDLRSALQYRILLNLVSALGVSKLLFFFITAPNTVVTCKAVSGTLMYTLLAFFGWMSVEAFHLYKTFVHADVWIIGKQAMTDKFRLYSAFAWGVPGLCVAAALIADSDGMISIVDVRVGDQVIDSTIDYCWFDKHGKARWFFLVPMLLSVLINFAVSTRVFLQLRQLRSGLNKRRKQGRRGELSSRMASTIENVKAMFMVGSTTGAGWLLAILVLFQVGGVGMQYVFTVVNALQGCLILYCHVLLKQEGRSFWMEMKKRLRLSLTRHTSLDWKRRPLARIHRQTEGAQWAWRTTNNIIIPMSKNAPRKTLLVGALTVDSLNSGGLASPTIYMHFDGFQFVSSEQSIYDDVNSTIGGEYMDAVEPPPSPLSRASVGSSAPKNCGADQCDDGGGRCACDAHTELTETTVDSTTILWQPPCATLHDACTSTGSTIQINELDAARSDLPTMATTCRSQSYSTAVELSTIRVASPVLVTSTSHEQARCTCLSDSQT